MMSTSSRHFPGIFTLKLSSPLVVKITSEDVTRAESTVSSALDSRNVLSRRRGYLDLGSQLISTNRQRLTRSERDRRIRMQTSLACYGGYPIAFHLFIASSNSPASPPLVTSMPTKYSNSDQGRIIESSWKVGFYL